MRCLSISACEGVSGRLITALGRTSSSGASISSVSGGAGPTSMPWLVKIECDAALSLLRVDPPQQPPPRQGGGSELGLTVVGEMKSTTPAREKAWGL